MRRIVFYLSLSSAFALILLLVRMLYSGELMYGFLIWNLFLAAVPFFLAFWAKVLHKKNQQTKIIRLELVIFFWLLFFPNSLYIITDFIHLKQRWGVPLWYDIVLIANFAGLGVLLGFMSLRLVQKIVQEYFNKITSWIFVVVSLGLAGLGIYLGRFLRWNSWDMLVQPGKLLNDVFDRIVNPLSHPRTYGVVFVFWIFFLLAYLIFITFSEQDNIYD